MIKIYSTVLLVILSFISINVNAQFIYGFKYLEKDTTRLDTIYEFVSLEDALKNPDKVVRLNLSKQKLSEFPEDIFKFKNLEVLIMKKNKLKSIPSKIKSLDKLQFLDLEKNKLDSLPIELGELSNLKALIAGSNKLGELPMELHKLSQLKLIDIWGNPIDNLPVEFESLKNTLVELNMQSIFLNQEKADAIYELLPNTDVHIDSICNCH